MRTRTINRPSVCRLHLHRFTLMEMWSLEKMEVLLLFYWLQLSAVFTALEAALLKIGNGIEFWSGKRISTGTVSIVKHLSRLKLKFPSVHFSLPPTVVVPDSTCFPTAAESI